MTSDSNDTSHSVRTWGKQAVRFGAVEVDVIELDEAVDAIMSLTSTGKVELVVTPNVDHLVKVPRDEKFAAAYDRAALRVADGQPLIWASKLLRLPLRTKVAGSDLLIPVLTAAAERDVPVFFLGATDESAAVAEEELRRQIPGLNVVGRASPMYKIGEPVNEGLAAAIDQLNASGAKLVVTAFGAPKQEILVNELADRLPPACYCGFGAALDFASGTAQRAPKLASDLGLEWLWRLLKEPKRLWRRYLVDDIGFIPIFAKMVVDRVRRRPLVVNR